MEVRRNSSSSNGMEGITYIIPIHKKGNTDRNNYRGISLPTSTYKILSNILLTRLTAYANEIIGDYNVDFGTIGQLVIRFSTLNKFYRIIGI